jgi:FlaA1/EpsC-like NDP-sugar epimerase
MSRRHKRLALLLLDAALAAVALAAAGFLLHGAGALPALPSVAGLAAAAAAALVASAATGHHRVRLAACGALGLRRGAAFAAAAAVALAPFAPVAGGGAVLATFALVLFVAGLAVRLALRQALLWLRAADGGRRAVLIWGAGQTGQQLAAALRDHPLLRPVAFLDDCAALQGVSAGDLAVHPPAAAARLARRHGADRVLLAMPSLPPARLAAMARRLAGQGLAALPVPSFAQLAGVGTAAEPADADLPGRLLGRPQLAADLPVGTAYAGRSVLVTGAGGSVGGELCRQLIGAGVRRLVLLEQAEPALYAIDRDLRPAAAAAGVELVPLLGSAGDAACVGAALRDAAVEVVLHAAAHKHVPLVEANPLAGIANNVLVTRSLAVACAVAGVGRFVLVSTDKAVRPSGVMGATKRLAEQIVQDIARRTPATGFAIVRFGNVLGSSGSVVPLFRDQIARGGPVTVTHPEATRYFMTLPEAARLVLVAGSFAAPGDAALCVLDMGAPVRILDLARQMIAAAGLEPRLPGGSGGDIEIVFTGLRPGEKLTEELLIGGTLAATPHPKIRVAREPAPPPLRLAAALRALRAAVERGDAAAGRAVLARLVETGPPQPAAIAAE